MTSLLQEAISFPLTITKAAYKIATWAHIGAVVTTIGSIAAFAEKNQPLLNILFGQQKGAVAAIACTAIAQGATLMTAHGQPLNPDPAAAPVLANILAAAEPLAPVAAPVPQVPVTIVNNTSVGERVEESAAAPIKTVDAAPPAAVNAPEQTVPLVSPPEAIP